MRAKEGCLLIYCRWIGWRTKLNEILMVMADRALISTHSHDNNRGYLLINKSQR